MSAIRWSGRWRTAGKGKRRHPHQFGVGFKCFVADGFCAQVSGAEILSSVLKVFNLRQRQINHNPMLSHGELPQQHGAKPAGGKAGADETNNDDVSNVG